MGDFVEEFHYKIVVKFFLVISLIVHSIFLFENNKSKQESVEDIGKTMLTNRLALLEVTSIEMLANMLDFYIVSFFDNDLDNSVENRKKYYLLMIDLTDNICL
jgi:NADH:ubiquinone oxidoreductase subunit 6 (subunit J)